MKIPVVGGLFSASKPVVTWAAFLAIWIAFPLLYFGATTAGYELLAVVGLVMLVVAALITVSLL